MLQGKELRDTCLGSATSGLVARLLCHPLDTAKARLQGPEGSSFRNTWHVLRATMGTERIRGLYRGIGAVTFGGVPGVCLYLTTYEATKELLADRGAIGGGDAESGGEGILTHLTAGMMAEVVCCVVFVPVDVVKERLQVQRPAGAAAAKYVSTAEASSGGSRAGGSSSGVREASVPPYRGSADTLKTILRTEGLRGIYKGYLATLASFGPFSALYFMFYEQAKMASQDLIERHPYFRGQGGTDARAAEGAATATTEGQSARGGRAELPVWMTLGNAAAASAAASWLTNPLDLAKLRLQVQRGAAATASQPPAVATTAATAPYTGMLDALRRSYRAGGLAGLFKGSGARMAFQAPSIGITMAAFEKSKEMWGSLLP
ncbi:conserved unknown protein [Ectocarpus siliculosus]|uniref:Mitochondrial carrier protein n=1 Tax=Ectocarpus siliculosus TaxID=2880 RepID=D7FYX8_ECTSI|nr:conserved unknown protein [Ectocarpus siliculosus]|eukprot:CBJ26620.1 conserved unknown protein [Ectocarpus siliculosus]